MKSTLIILTFNEINGVQALYNKIPFNKVDEYFVIDGGSTDGTIEFFEKKGIKVIPQKIHGRGEAFRIGMKKAKGKYIVYFSPDGNEDPNDILKLIAELEKGSDIAIASRFMKGSKSDDAGIFRGFGNKAFTAIANIIWNGSLTDNINGFRAVKKEKLKELNLDAHGFGIEYQMSIRAMKLKYKIKEIPTYEPNRIGGFSTAGSFDTGLYFIKLILHELKVGKKFLEHN